MNKNKIRKVIFLLIFTAGFLIIPLKSPAYAQPAPIINTPIPNTPAPEDGIEGKEICKQIGDQCKKLPPSEQQGCEERAQKCNECFKARGGAYTALGCIPADASGFVGWLLGPLIGIAGGIAFLLILGGGFSILFSQGNPETIAAGQERITAAILGLLVIIFSVLILKVIGVDILQLPGFE
jgi:hypothetical protein